MQSMQIDRSEEAGHGIDENPSNPVVAARVTHAPCQTAIPVIRSISIENKGDRHFEACRLDLASITSFLRAESWSLDRLFHGYELNLGYRTAERDAGWLGDLDEAIARARRHSTTSKPAA